MNTDPVTDPGAGDEVVALGSGTGLPIVPTISGTGSNAGLDVGGQSTSSAQIDEPSGTPVADRAVTVRQGGSHALVYVVVILVLLLVAGGFWFHRRYQWVPGRKS